MKTKLQTLPYILALILALAGAAFGQETTGAIEGVVTDSQGGRVPGATVLVEGNAFSRTLTTDDQGSYRLLKVPAGIYTVTSSAPNFTSHRIENVEVALGRATITNMLLQAAGVAATVDISGSEVAQIDVTNNKIQTNITSQVIEQIPRGTNFSSVLGVSPATRAEPLNAGFQIDGASGAENTFILDGSEVTNFRTGQLRAVNNLPFEFVEEVQVKTSGFDAEYGGATGGVVNVVTKSGSNEWHGQVGLKFEVSELFARTTQNQTAGAPGTFQRIILNPSSTTLSFLNPPRDSFTNTYPSGTLSGPVIRDKVWFFVSGAPQFFRTTRFNEVSGVRSQEDLRRDYEFARVDAAPIDKLQLTGTYTYSPQRQHGQLVPVTTGNVVDFTERGGRVAAQNYTVGGVYTFNDRIILSARFARNYLNEKDNSYGIPDGTRFRCPNSNNIGLPGVTAAGACGGGFDTGDNTRTFKDISTRKNFDVDGSILVNNLAGRHNFKGGYQWNKLFNDVDQGFFNAGRIDFFFGQTSRDIGGGPGELGNIQLTRFGTVGEAGSTNQALYVQDSWQPFTRLTLNLGVRFEKEDVPTFSATGLPIEFGWGDKIAPRLGAAFDVRGDGTWKIFGSFGRFYDRFKYELPRGSFGGDQFLRTWVPIINPNINTYTVQSILSTPGALTLDFRVPSNDPSDNRIDPDLDAARQTEFTVGTEYELRKNLVISSRYTHKKVDRAIEDVGFIDNAGNENFFIANPGFGLVSQSFASGLPATPKAERKYDAIEVRAVKRFADSYYFDASYTWSRLFGNYSGLASSDERGRSSPNVNRFFDLPFLGFNANGEPDNGRLATDRPHAVKLFGSYTADWQKFLGSGGGRNSTQFSASFIGMSGSPLSTQVSFFNADTFLFGRGDLGRTPAFTQTDFYVSHTYKFGSDSRYAMKLEANVVNLFNENNVLDKFTRITPNDIGDADVGAADELDAFRKVFAGGIQSIIVQQLNNGTLPSDARYNQPSTFQIGRQVRFGFGFSF